jgi:hypothetical protein
MPKRIECERCGFVGALTNPSNAIHSQKGCDLRLRRAEGHAKARATYPSLAWGETEWAAVLRADDGVYHDLLKDMSKHK